MDEDRVFFKTVVVLNALEKTNSVLLQKSFLEDLVKTPKDLEKTILNAGQDQLKQAKPLALSVKSLATGLLSVLCVRKPNFKRI
jgi:hypothetical protein